MNILFDVDGTLVQSYALDSRLFLQAVNDIVGEVRLRPDWHAYRHVTDQGIFADICADSGCSVDLVGAVRARFADLIATHFASDPAACPQVPGAGAMFAALAARADVGLGLATGGWGVTAAAKLAQAGIAYEPSWLFSSDIAHERVAIMRACLAGVGRPSVPIVYVGDGEWDMTATAALGWDFIGVGERLRGKCPRWVADFRGPEFARHLDEISGGTLRL